MKFVIDTSNLDIDINDLAILEYDNEEFNILDCKIDNSDNTINIICNKSEATYCIVNKNKYNQNKTQSFYTLKTNLNKQKQLKKELKKLVQKDVSFKVVRHYNSDRAVDVILKYDANITSASKKYGINKAMIQAILLRELTCVNAADDIADSSVMEYYNYKQELGNYMKLSWTRQLLVGPPTAPVPYKEDSSTRLGQIFAKTGINARNYTLQTHEAKTSYSNWKQRKSIWYNLKYKNTYNITMVTRVLKMEKMKLPASKRTVPMILTRYNNDTKNSTSKYGNICYRYYNIFKRYN